MRTLPPMRALVAFDSVAGNGSVTLAGKELNISQSAVSHRLRQIEDYLGESLLFRSGRKLELTEIGRNYFSEVDRILRDLSIATGQITDEAHTHIRFHVYSSFAIKALADWLYREVSMRQSSQGNCIK
ncbi:LysR family transcriptional regulator [Parendozoicomonas sp. Alg238-R29]|uniref:LysR family transcriptional regulator n=1 Tax=Parendozoicomonas sp. Alg238-R29 TaxID=2993446 RepID=UPI00248DB6A8|nr:LysR family transcriptional regulator [Parendozoicomonas sp. Alg238-R29]